MLALIDDCVTGSRRMIPFGCREQAKAILDLRLQRLTALGRDEIAEEFEKLAARSTSISKSCAPAPASRRSSRPNLSTSRGRIRDAAADRDHRTRSRHRGRGPHPARGHGRHRHPRRLCQARAVTTYRAQRRGGKGRAGMPTHDEDFVTRLFVASTHAAVLFFSSRGKAYKVKVWRLPMAPPQARGKALINCCRSSGERITSIMPLPEDESFRAQAHMMFATTGGTVRRNELTDFVDVNRSGMIAMKLEEGEAIVDVQICSDRRRLADDRERAVHPFQGKRPSTRQGRGSQGTDVRVFNGRTSIGVRGSAGRRRESISMSIFRHVDVSPEERAAYFGCVGRYRRGGRGRSRTETRGRSRRGPEPWRQNECSELQRAEQYILTVTENGFGKRTSSFAIGSPAGVEKVSWRWISARKGGELQLLKDRQAGGILPGGRRRPNHAGHRRGQLSAARRRTSASRTLDARRDRLQHRRGRACRLVERSTRRRTATRMAQ